MRHCLVLLRPALATVATLVALGGAGLAGLLWPSSLSAAPADGLVAVHDDRHHRPQRPHRHHHHRPPPPSWQSPGWHPPHGHVPPGYYGRPPIQRPHWAVPHWQRPHYDARRPDSRGWGDRDRDGVPNRWDAAPRDPWRS